jgi:cobalt-zinc-cadmium efflux system protein
MFSLQWCECDCTDDPEIILQSQQKTKMLWLAAGLLTCFFVVEWTVGLWSQSLSLQADAGHMFSDIAALVISLFSTYLAQQPAKGKATFGNQRVEVLAALLNGLSLLAIATFITWEAIQRWQHPGVILGLPMLVVAVMGLIVNLLNISLLHPHSHNDLNLQGALLHIIADTASSVGVIIAAVMIHLWDWWWADVAISLVVATFTGVSALPLVQESIKIFLEYAPKSIDPVEVEKLIKSFAGVVQVEKLHIWTISSNKVMLCANVIVECATNQERDRLINKLQIHLQENFKIAETTLQLTSPPKSAKLPLHPLFNQDLSLMLAANKSN